jgi:hypothetical protein
MTTETLSLAAACIEAALMCERRSQEEQRDGRDGRILAERAAGLREAAARLESQPAAAELWSDISTAPHDGTVIAVQTLSGRGLNYDPQEPYTARWSGNRYQVGGSSWSREVKSIDGPHPRYVCNPTHWAPLPKAEP